MYPNIGSSTPQPSAPPGTQSTTATTTTATTASSLTNSNAANLLGFSSLMSQPNNQNTPYPTGPTSQSMYPGQQPPSQAPYPPGQGQQPPYPAGPQSSPYANPYPANNPRAPGPPNSSGYSPYAPPQFGATAPSQGAGYQANPHPPPASNPYQASNPSAGYQQPPPPGQGQNPYPAPASNPYQASNPPGGSQQGYSGYQQPPPGQGQNAYPPANPYQPQAGNASNQNPYRPANPYAAPQGYPNPSQPANLYPQQSGGYPQQQQLPPSQYQNQNPYPPAPQGGGYGGYPPYQQQPNPSPYGQQPPGGGYNANNYGAPAMNDRLRAIAGRHEINDALAQRLNILQQFELVVLCDDSGSMNTPVDGTQGTRWDELRAIVQIIIEIGVIFDSNGVDVHFLNRAAMPNVTDPRQVMESFSQRPGGLTPLTASLRRIFQSAASKPGSDKRLLVFVATDGAPTDANGQVDIQGLENLMRNERQANTTYVTFLACTDDEASVAYLSQWDRTMMNVDVVDDYKTEREEVRRARGHNYPFSFGDYVVKALLGAVDPQMDMLDEQGNNNNQYPNPNTNNNFRRY